MAWTQIVAEMLQVASFAKPFNSKELLAYRNSSEVRGSFSRDKKPFQPFQPCQLQTASAFGSIW